MPTAPTEESCALVIFGASGDLTRRKLLPALYNLQAEDLMPQETAVVGTARRAYAKHEFVAAMGRAVSEH